ncbi:MAG TPA: hypothetical protein VND64_34360, partial [Pirellulales bacterium]|nr:hypothetical protein [Pirellulales bacterium]
SDAKLVFEAQTRLGDKYAWKPDLLYQGPPIEWLPDGSGWLLYGRYLFDRKSFRVVWKLHSTSDKRFRFLDQQTLAVVRGGRFGGKLVGIRIPWDSITAELADKESKHEKLPFVHSLQ